jgi:hypothetical protein
MLHAKPRTHFGIVSEAEASGKSAACSVITIGTRHLALPDAL